jgi:hypothetical protein
MKIETKTKKHSDYYDDTAIFEDDGDFIEIRYNGEVFSIRKSAITESVNCRED